MTRLLDRGIATADDVAEGIEPPEGVDPRYLGTVPGPLARARIIHHVGYVKSDRPSRHASVLTLWGLTDRAAALAWLAHNPDIPDPPLEDEDGDADMPCQAPPTPPPSRLTSQSLLF